MKKIFAFTFCIIMLAALFAMPSSVYATEGEPAGEMLDEIIIKFYDKSLFTDKEKQYDDEVSKILKDGLSVVTDNVYVIKAEDLSKNPNAILNRYKNSQFIEYVEPNYVGNFDAVPNDPDYSKLRALLTVINAQPGWDIISEGSAVVAVVDSGVAQHADLPELLNGYSAVSGLSPNNDKVGHGTGVAGTIGASGNNGMGTVGINWKASIMPVKVDDAKGNLSVANIAKGIIWAADNGARVISLSVSTTSDSVTLKNAVNYAYSKGCALFASTGNDGKGSINYPARYPNVMAVGATASGTSRAAISNYGSGMGVVAITSYQTTTSSGGYTAMSGTSFSTPQVSGLASLIWSLNPSLTNDEVYSYIQQGAKPIGGGYNEQTGYGMIDIGNTLALVANSAPQKEKDTTPPVLTLNGNEYMDIELGQEFIDPGYTAVDDTDGDISVKVTVTGSVNNKLPGVYKLEYIVSDEAGNESRAIREVEVVFKDYIPPLLTLIGGYEMQVEQGETFVEPGYTAIDGVDGDITHRVEVTGFIDESTPGIYIFTYEVSDMAGNASVVTREVEVVNVLTEPDPDEEPWPYEEPEIPEPGYATPPVIKLKGSEEVTLFIDEEYNEAGYWAEDCNGIDLTGAVRVTDNINIWTPGVYKVDYRVEDSNGNTARATRTVFVIEDEAPERPANAPTITIIGSDPIILHLDSDTPYTEQGAYAYDEADGDISDDVQIHGRVDRDSAGTYTLTYEVENSAGLFASATRTVRILEPTETQEPRATYNFSGQGKASSSNTHRNVIAEAAGWMDFRVTSIDKNMVVDVAVTDQDSGETVFSDTFTSAGGTQFWVEEGRYSVDVNIVSCKGNGKYGVRLETPEVMYMIFDEEEIPLGFSIDLYIVTLGYTMQEISDAELPFTKDEMYAALVKNGYSEDQMISFGFTKEELSSYYIEIDEAKTPLGATAVYVVKEGDSLWSIAKKQYGDSSRWGEIYNMNKNVIGNNPRVIYAGQVLRIKAE